MSVPAPSTGLGERVIVEAALNILEAKGVEGLTMRALADALGVSVGAAYKHVSSKHALLQLVSLELESRAVAQERPEAEPFERVRHLLVTYRAVMAPYAGLAAYLSQHLEDMAPGRLSRIVHDALVAAGFRGDGPERAARVLFFYTSGAQLTLPAAGPVPADLVAEWFEDGLAITLNGLRQELPDRP
jgi:TetR/AcrR family tetracycline transcriptional repressor